MAPLYLHTDVRESSVEAFHDHWTAHSDFVEWPLEILKTFFCKIVVYNIEKLLLKTINYYEAFRQNIALFASCRNFIRRVNLCIQMEIIMTFKRYCKAVNWLYTVR